MASPFIRSLWFSRLPHEIARGDVLREGKLIPPPRLALPLRERGLSGLLNFFNGAGLSLKDFSLPCKGRVEALLFDDEFLVFGLVQGGVPVAGRPADQTAAYKDCHQEGREEQATYRPAAS